MITTLEEIAWLVTGSTLYFVAFWLTEWGDRLCGKTGRDIELDWRMKESVLFFLSIFVAILFWPYAAWLCLRAIGYVRKCKCQLALTSTGK